MKKSFIVLFLLSLIVMISCKQKSNKKIVKRTTHELLGKVVDKNDTITMDKFIGMNGFVDDSAENLAAVGFIREYHNWSWDEGNGDPNYPGFPYNQIKFAPSYPWWNYDDFYSSLKKLNVDVAPCIQGSVGWLNSANNFPYDDKPLDNVGLDASDPESYYKKAHFMFQFAARYGSQKNDSSLLTLAPGQKRVSGLGLVKYIEDWNEPDKTWKGKNAYFSPDEYAAMISADCDGHCNTLNKIPGKYGVKNADSTIKLVMGGITSINLDYIKKMKTWFELNRKDKKFPMDVINFHIYAFKNSDNIQAGGPPLSPEDANFEDQLAEVVKYRNEFLPNVEVWVSEFGWDTNPNSVLCAPAIGPFDIQEVQGIWLVRAYLAFIAAGVDRAQMYMSRDIDTKDATWFSTCGLTGPKGDFSPKKSWYYVSTLKNVLKNKIYVGQLNSSDPNVSIYKFKDLKNKDGVYIAWANTSKNYIADNIVINLNSKVDKAEQIDLVAGNKYGESQNLTIQEGKLHVKVTEKPIFIKVSLID